jgi:DNA-binding response OmpR family regulator
MKNVPVKILVVEDDPDILNAINVCLGMMGFDVDVMLNGKQILMNHFVLPDLFIVDKLLPEIDGVQICRYLKSKPNCKDIPVIMISASQKIKDEALKAGAFAFIAKPFAIRELMDVIREALESRNAIK